MSEGPDIGRVDGVAQRRAAGGYYTQAQVDEIMAMNLEWTVEYLVMKFRFRPDAPDWVKGG